MMSESTNYNGPDGIDGCLLLYLLFRHHYMISKERLDDLAMQVEKEEGCGKCGWRSAIVQAATSFSNRVEVKKTGQPRNRMQSQPPSLCNTKEAMSSKRLDFINEL